MTKTPRNGLRKDGQPRRALGQSQFDAYWIAPAYTTHKWRPRVGKASSAADRAGKSILNRLRRGASSRTGSAAAAAALFCMALTIMGACSSPAATSRSQSCANTAAIADPESAGLIADCETMLILKEKLAGTVTLNWSLNRPITDWEGVTVAQDRVTELTLTDQLEGIIPPELSQLTNLEWLDLGGNLQGHIPTELGQLSNLRMLRLDSNQLTGGIPAELGQLTNLRWLALMDNQLEGEIPAELGQLAKLGTLALSGNQLEGRIPAELGQLTNLRSLQLKDNFLRGPIPAELAKFTNLEYMVLSGNQLEGGIPVWLSQLTNLKWLYLDGNRLKGAIPAELGQLTNLEALGLSDNQLEGSTPAELGQLENLLILYLNGNQLKGRIPTELGQLTNLWLLDIDGNPGLCGPIPLALQRFFESEDLGICEDKATRRQRPCVVGHANWRVATELSDLDQGLDEVENRPG